MNITIAVLISVFLTQVGSAQPAQSAEPKQVPAPMPTEGIDGFIIVDMQPGSIYEKLGLRQGDVIKVYNGQPVNSTEQMLALYGKLSTAKKFDLEIQRDGKVEKLKYDLK